MTRTTVVPMGPLARTLFLAVPFAAMACGGDDSAASIPSAEARPVITSVAPPTPPATGTVGTTGGGTVTPTSFPTAGEAYKGGNYRVATEMYKTHLGTVPNDWHGYYMLGLSSWKAGDFDGAKVAFDKSIELNPKFAKSYFNQGRVLLDLKRPGEAMEVITKGQAFDSTSSEGARLVARAMSESGDVEGAKAVYRQLLVHDDADAWALNNLGMLELQKGDVQEALGPLARAVQVRPTAPLFLNNLGMALERSGYKVVALRQYELAVKHDPEFVKAVRNLDRMKTVVTDTTLVEEVSVKGLAEEFRLRVKAWAPQPFGELKISDQR